jgi:outer membrane protein OmpA-like peptidoglycan-associated protein
MGFGAGITGLALVLCVGMSAYGQEVDERGRNLPSAATQKSPAGVPFDFSIGVNGTNFAGSQSFSSDGQVSANPGIGFGLSGTAGIRIFPFSFGELQAVGTFVTPEKKSVTPTGSGFAYPIIGGYAVRMDKMAGLGLRFLFDIGEPGDGAKSGFGDRWAASLGLQQRFERYSVTAPTNGGSASFSRPWMDAGMRWYPSTSWNRKGLEPYVDVNIAAPLRAMKVSGNAYRDGLSTTGIPQGMPIVPGGDVGSMARVHAAGFTLTLSVGIRFGKPPVFPPLPRKAKADPVVETPKAPEVEPTRTEDPKPVVQRPRLVEVDGLVVRFAFDKSTISADAALGISEWVRKNKGIVDPAAMVLVGHADNTGGETHNDKLSLERAKSVLVKLREAGFDTANIEISGKGFRDPLAPNGTQMGRGFNRRVELFFKASSSFRTRTRSFMEGIPDYTKDPHVAAKPAAPLADSTPKTN